MPLLPLLCCRVGVLGFGCRGFPCPPLSSTYLHTFHYTHTGGERGGGGVRFEVLRVELRGSTRLLLLEGASSHTRAPNRVKFSKFANLSSVSRALPGLPGHSFYIHASQIVPRFFIILPRLRRHGILLRKRTPSSQSVPFETEIFSEQQ